MKIIILKGLPGSGKSTWAKEYIQKNPEFVRVNKDSIREMIAGYPLKTEGLVLRLRNRFIQEALNSGKSVIVDDTNFHPKHEEYFRALVDASKGEVELEVKFFDTPLKDCIANDLKRARSVGEAVIRKMHNQYLVKREPKKNWRLGLRKAVIVDIDGTVALSLHRNPFDTSRYHTDVPNRPIVAMVREFARQGFAILFTSGRDATFLDVTTKWLFDNVLNDLSLPGGMRVSVLMRLAGDRREDSIVKQELYENYIKGRFNVFAVLDDRNRVVDMWRRNGLTCLQVADGDF